MPQPEHLPDQCMHTLRTDLLTLPGPQQMLDTWLLQTTHERQDRTGSQAPGPPVFWEAKGAKVGSRLYALMAEVVDGEHAAGVPVHAVAPAGQSQLLSTNSVTCWAARTVQLKPFVLNGPEQMQFLVCAAAGCFACRFLGALDGREHNS